MAVKVAAVSCCLLSVLLLLLVGAIAYLAVGPPDMISSPFGLFGLFFIVFVVLSFLSFCPFIPIMAFVGEMMARRREFVGKTHFYIIDVNEKVFKDKDITWTVGKDCEWLEMHLNYLKYPPRGADNQVRQF